MVIEFVIKRVQPFDFEDDIELRLDPFAGFVLPHLVMN